jgi:hypothetical protein
MRRKLARMHRVAGPAAMAAVTLALVLAGCGSSGGSGAAGQPSGSVLSPAAGSSPDDSLAQSHMKVLTRLTRPELCGLVSAARATQILGARTAAPSYSRSKGVGNTCVWVKRGAPAATTDELYVGVSALFDWSGAQAVDQRLLHTRRVTVDTHPALAAPPQGHVTWAQVDVALGGPQDPFAEYRAPTLAAALALAKAATPLIVARG